MCRSGPRGRRTATNWFSSKRSDWTACKGCLEKQQKIDRLQEENQRLKDRLRYQQRQATEGPFGASTPSSKIPLKPNSLEENQAKKGGAKPGHPGHGRRACPREEMDHVIPVHLPATCPDCGVALEARGVRRRTVIDAQPLKSQQQLLLLDVKRCPKCRRIFRATAPGVLPKGLFTNRFLSIVATEHYLHGLTLGQLAKQLRVHYSSLVAALHGLARRFPSVIPALVKEYRHAPVKQADETGWRCDGRSGYAWLFCTDRLTLFRFRSSRSAKVVQEVLGTRRLPGTLVVDRYSGYNQAPCDLQYCYAHLLRDTEDIQKEFPDNPEVARFVRALAPQLSAAMGLRQQPLSPRQFKRQAALIQSAIQHITSAPASHPGIQHLQNIFREHSRRMYRWALDPRIPADNNRSERELRSLVLARKVSFGSQSDAGAQTREILMSVLFTLKKRHPDPVLALTAALDALAANSKANLYPLLFASNTS